MTVTTFVLALSCASLHAADVAGVVKTSRGSVSAERATQSVALSPGASVSEGDRIVTGGDGYVGITMRDDTLLTLGPNASLKLDKYAFDPKTHEGGFLGSLGKGVLSVVTGLLPRHKPEQFAVRTRISTMGVRGTEFVIDASE